MRFVDRFSAIAFDMNGTFMFGHDRFGEDQDFAATYRALGGTRLSATEVRHAVRATVEGLAREYADASGYERFPSLREGIDRYARVSEADLAEIERVIAAHERGAIPQREAMALTDLARTHRLCVVSNLWAHPREWDCEFERAGLDTAFEFRLFSSLIGSIKPSPTMFRRALANLALPPERVLFVGDDLERDIHPAKALGMATVRVARDGFDRAADRCVTSIAELLEII